MKHSISLFLAAVLVAAATSIASAQVSDSAVYGSSGFLRKATPSPSPGGAAASTTAAAPGKPLEANLSKSEKGKSDTATFSASDKSIYLVWSDGTATKGEKIRAVWTAEDTGGAISKNKKLIDTSKVAAGPSGGSFILDAPKGGFPPGTYRADLYEGSKVAKTLKFKVTK